jgi:hypothetical protein
MKRLWSEERLSGANREIKKPIHEDGLFFSTCIKSKDDLIEKEHPNYV